MIQQQLVKDEKKESDKELTAKALLSLKNKYGRNHGWSAYTEVSVGGRQADLIAFNVYPSREFCIVGCEIKASRSDWMKELEHPEKADHIISQCDEWYIVEARQGIIKKEELPKGWGLMSLRGNSLYQKVHSTKEESKFTKEFLARIVEQSYHNNENESLLREAEMRGYQKGRNEQADSYEMEKMRRRTKILDNLEAAEIKINEWDLRHIKRLRLALDFINIFGEYGLENRLNSMIHGCESAAEKGREAQKILEELRNTMKVEKKED